MSIFQLLASIFALFMLYIVSIHKKRASLSPAEVVFWYLTWGGFIVIALFPNLLKGAVDVLNFSRVFDLLTVIGMMIITSLVITNYFQQKENARKLERFVRKEAINHAAKKPAKKN